MADLHACICRLHYLVTDGCWAIHHPTCSHVYTTHTRVTPPLQSTTPGLHPVSIRRMAPPVRGSRHPITAYYSVYRPQNDERLSWLSWLTCRGSRTVYPRKWSPINCRSSTEQGKFAGQRPTFYRCATPPTKGVIGGVTISINKITQT